MQGVVTWLLEALGHHTLDHSVGLAAALEGAWEGHESVLQALEGRGARLDNVMHTDLTDIALKVGHGQGGAYLYNALCHVIDILPCASYLAITSWLGPMDAVCVTQGLLPVYPRPCLMPQCLCYFPNSVRMCPSPRAADATRTGGQWRGTPVCCTCHQAGVTA